MTIYECEMRRCPVWLPCVWWISYGFAEWAERNCLIPFGWVCILFSFHVHSTRRRSLSIYYQQATKNTNTYTQSKCQQIPAGLACHTDSSVWRQSEREQRIELIESCTASPRLDCDMLSSPHRRRAAAPRLRTIAAKPSNTARQSAHMLQNSWKQHTEIRSEKLPRIFSTIWVRSEWWLCYGVAGGC